MKKWMAILALALVVGACGGDEAPGEAQDSLEPDDTGELESALTYSFTCRCLSERSVGAAGCGVRGPRTLKATVNSRTVKLSGSYEGGNGSAEAGSYRYDSSYRGQGSNANYRRYKGDPRVLLVESDLVRGGYPLRSGGKGGYLQYTYTGDAYENVKYICRR